MNSSTYFNEHTTRFFSLGRHALVAALKVAGVGTGQLVLLPEYICRDLLASIHAVGAKPIFYPVGVDMLPASLDSDWPLADAVLAVNYFGFPQPLEIFRSYCQRTGAVLIEDNAHGFLSCDENNQPLGLRGDIGIFSMRKVLVLANGAALTIQRADLIKHLAPQCQFKGNGRRLLRAKAMFLRLPLVGQFLALAATRIVRTARKLRFGYEFPQPAVEAERFIPPPENPYKALLTDLQRYNFEGEVARRRALYSEFLALFHDWDIKPVFTELPAYTSPYGFAFEAEEDMALKIKKIAGKRGFDVFRWPDLPDALPSKTPEYYRRIWLLNLM